MNVTSSNLALLRGCKDAPFALPESGPFVHFWLMQEEYGCRQRTLVTRLVTTPGTRDFRVIDECCVNPDGSVDHYGRDPAANADMLLRVIKALRQDEMVWCRL